MIPNSGFRPGAMPGFINNPQYMFNQRYSEKKSVNKINGIASHGIYGNVKKSMSGFGSPYMHLFPDETRMPGNQPISILQQLLAKVRAAAAATPKTSPDYTRASKGKQAFAALDIESFITDFMTVRDMDAVAAGATGDPFTLGKAYIKDMADRPAPRPIAFALSDPQGRSMGYSFIDDMAGFDVKEFEARGLAPGKRINLDFIKSTFSDETIRKLLGLPPGAPITGNINDELIKRLNIKHSGAGFAGEITQSQLDYINSVVKRSEINYFARSVQEGLTTEGARGVKTHAALIHGVADILEAAAGNIEADPSGNKRLVGFNLKSFDIPQLQKMADAAGIGDRFRKAVGAFKIVDVMEEYAHRLQKVAAPIDLPGIKSRSFSLDVVSRAYERHDSILKNLIAKRGVHAAGRDAAITARVFELMNDNKVQLTMADHMLAVIRRHDQMYGKTVSLGVDDMEGNFAEKRARSLADRTEAVAWLKKNKAAQKRKVLRAAKKMAKASKKPGAGGGAAGGELNKMINNIAANVHPGVLAGGLAIGGILLFGALFSDEDETPLDKLNQMGRYLTNRRADRKEWISASALQLEGNDRFYRLIDPSLERRYERQTDTKRNKERRVQEQGTATHTMVQDMLEAQGLGQREVYTEDTRNKVFGYIDFMLKGGIPLEIKSTEYDDWDAIKAPKEPHVRQATFDTMATDSPYAYIMYVPRGMPEKQKTFMVYRDPSRYAADVSAAREIQEKYGDVVESGEPELSGFRPLGSLLNNISNDRVMNADLGYNKSKIRDQKSRLATSGAGGSYNRLGNAKHANESSRGSGGGAYG